ncbi:RHS repeat domain-containing protein [Pseudomonas sp. Marseille-P9899]|uniref:RHS repeat domain-containing protein n=1 Tax=Pseudomonas sp. Marseille-P9899 TaxID=2730401 RepID=UPI00158F2A28|nr:RHS repeat protein [Pseudomonas sp. Marseille-P9899]
MHAKTPHLTVSDPRGLTVRSVDYCRVAPGAAAQLRIDHTCFDTAGQRVEQRDPRLWALPEAPANLVTVQSLSGQVLGSDGVDNGWCCSLSGEAGQVVCQWDGRGSRRTVEYDDLLRPVAVFEQSAHQPQRCSERFTYADGRDENGQHNRSGRLLRHDDTAGTRRWSGFSLTGEASTERRHFLAATDGSDWPVAIDARDALLEAGEGASTNWRHGPLGQVLEQTDAGGHRQSFHSQLSGELQQVRVQLVGQPVQTLLSHARYNASGQMLEETLGNGVIIQRAYCEQDGRLLSLSARRETGETLQDIHYGYDPAGNVIQVEDRAQPLRHFANQRIEPRCHYRYDSLYQLIEASGWEAGATSKGQGTLNDPQARANYRQTYRYDAGGNLLELTHVGAQSHGRILTADRHSNRCLEQFGDRPPSDNDFLERFDASGNRLELQPGRRLHWDVRNQLSEVHPVIREGAANDTERYLYDGAGQRVRKQRSALVAGRLLHSEVRYLPGLELHDNAVTDERLQIITVQAGTCGVRVLHWLAGRPAEIAPDQQRYALSDHLGSCTLELDETAALISHEVYYPFGGTAWMAGRSEIEVGYKTHRYSGKERDATGLYYYGARYYMPWLQRWLNPDPAGAVDGLNLYRMLRNSPLTHIDLTGHNSQKARERWRTAYNFHRKAIASVAPGIVKVHLSGDRSVFEAAGFPTDDSFPRTDH